MSIQSIIDGKFLSVCPASEAVAWLKGKREAILDLRFGRGPENKHEEQILANRSHPYIDFGLAKYGGSAEACKQVYERGDHAIKCTFLAYFPNGGFHPFYDAFILAEQHPNAAEELQAMLMNPSLADKTFTNCFEQKGAFAKLTEEEFQDVLCYAGDNARLSTPYDDSVLDGWSDHTYHKVFDAAWQLASTVPTTPRWANVLYQLLRNCEPPSTSFDPTPVLPRWHLQHDKSDIGFYLRNRLADLFKADNSLLKSNDPAL